MNIFPILDALSKQPEISQKMLAKLCQISIGKVNYTLNQLAKDDFINIEKAGKIFHYTITEKGREFLKKELDNMHETKMTLHNKEKKIIKQAVILAAGEKSDFDRPAGLLEIDETTAIERNMNILEANGIEKFIIVTGYKKEAFEQLESLKEKNVVLVENPKFLWTGSMSSLASVAEHISDDFILIEDDILIEENAIEQLLNHEERDCVLLTKESGSGDEAFVEIRNHYLYNITKDIHQLNRIDGEMIGVTKISHDVYKEMIAIFEDNKNPYLNYEYMLLDVSRKFDVGYLRIADLIWSEIDNKEHYLKVKDKFYPMLKRKEADFRERELKSMIGDVLDISIDKISNISALGGLTNRNFKMTIDGEEYAVRVPGKGTEAYIRRNYEKYNSELTSQIGINPETLYFNEDTGLKIVKYIPNAETLNGKTGKREDNLILVASTFRKLHHSDAIMKDRFDVFEKITEYETILADLNGKLFDGHEEVKQQVLALEDYYKSLNVKLTPCHNDPLAENFVKSGEDKMYLIDWEFSGMNDPLWDIAAYIIEAELSTAEETLFLIHYFDGKVTVENRRHVLMNKIFLDFLWTIWALMKEAGGEEFGLYAFNRFTRAQANLKEYNKYFKEIEQSAKI
ncbi:NTP transferase domain-containing protein [Bacillus sp. cl95]|uniref:NTP transferase domain-containing protein n=2 Tax=unclassified Bacillus (in: firmicutes) TaxID=185979 RepID=UPI0008F252F8|nr:NTP transferase domain-containing protein [Bacillus sp. cl95]SFB20967.1 Thiamine kinase [Bacillus sp. UNCCL13]SFQ90937.1 Thiamine kinase [Bacillus sp. cl95]